MQNCGQQLGFEVGSLHGKPVGRRTMLWKDWSPAIEGTGICWPAWRVMVTAGSQMVTGPYRSAVSMARRRGCQESTPKPSESFCSVPLSESLSVGTLKLARNTDSPGGHSAAAKDSRIFAFLFELFPLKANKVPLVFPSISFHSILVGWWTRTQDRKNYHFNIVPTAHNK